MPEPFKNLFNQAFFDALSGAVSRVYPAFDKATFLARIFDDQWEKRELKDRMHHTAAVLHSVLPDDYRTAIGILRQVSRGTDGLSFGSMVFPDFVEAYGLDDWETSIPALEQFTQQSSAEFAVRPFILKYPERMMAQMLAWAKHDSEQVRRLASEGCRPRLPWAIALPAFKADPSPILPILEQLKADPSEFVRRSVANNLNDIAKDNPQAVIDTLRRWRAEDASPEMTAILNRALRTLVKAGNPQALELLGFTHQATFAVKNLTVAPESIPMGGELTFSFDVQSLCDTPQALMIDYVMHLQRSNGKLTPKVFKLVKKTLAPGETVTISKRHSFRAVTTRKYYPGAHAIEIQINGVLCERQDFTVMG